MYWMLKLTRSSWNPTRNIKNHKKIQGSFLYPGPQSISLYTLNRLNTHQTGLPFLPEAFCFFIRFSFFFRLSKQKILIWGNLIECCPTNPHGTARVDIRFYFWVIFLAPGLLSRVERKIRGAIFLTTIYSDSRIIAPRVSRGVGKRLHYFSMDGWSAYYAVRVAHRLLEDYGVALVYYYKRLK